MLKTFRKILVAILAVILSAGLIFSIPIMNLWIKGDLGRKKYTKTEVTLIKQIIPEQKEQKKKQRRTPKRSRPNQRTLKSGPRFAMDLGVASGSGAGISTDLLKNAGGANTQGSLDGDVDEKPALRGSPAFQAPAAIRDAEINATVVLTFCVDNSGRVYDIRVAEESPAGMGLADAGRDALNRSSFSPARKDGNPVAFCGLEQPFEIRFRD